jgi:hypothetical protein
VEEDSLLSVKIELNGIPNPIPFRTSRREPEIKEIVKCYFKLRATLKLSREFAEVT